LCYTVNPSPIRPTEVGARMAVSSFGEEGASYADRREKSGVSSSPFSRNYTKFIEDGQVAQTKVPDGKDLFVWVGPKAVAGFR
jgi:hypothetical protein